MSGAGTGGGVRLLANGACGLLVDLGDAGLRRSLHRALTATPIPGVVEVVPAATTIGVQCGSPDDLEHVAALVERLVSAGLADVPANLQEPTVIRVRYDGDDLSQVAGLVGLTPTQLVQWHTGQVWTVDFAGFMPGFGYLTGEHGGLDVPRLASPRARIPAGSVALAGEFTGLYPQASPGGWQLIGRTDAELWRLDRTPPALLVPGARIRFVEVKP